MIDFPIMQLILTACVSILFMILIIIGKKCDKE